MKTHNERFSELESKYIESKNTLNSKANYYLDQMYLLIKEITYNYINDYCFKKGLTHIDKNEKAHDAAMFIILQYLKKPDFKIKAISSYAYFGIKKALFQNKNQEMNEVSYEQYFDEKKENTY
jgi:hypothetical protein